MATHKRITITMHPIELQKLKVIAKENHETISGMIQRLVMEYKRKKELLFFITSITIFISQYIDLGVTADLIC
jgi:hypothetical protein